MSECACAEAERDYFVLFFVPKSGDFSLLLFFFPEKSGIAGDVCHVKGWENFWNLFCFVSKISI